MPSAAATCRAWETRKAQISCTSAAGDAARSASATRRLLSRRRPTLLTARRAVKALRWESRTESGDAVAAVEQRAAELHAQAGADRELSASPVLGAAGDHEGSWAPREHASRSSRRRSPTAPRGSVRRPRGGPPPPPARPIFVQFAIIFDV